MKACRSPRRLVPAHARGFTLFELMLAIAVGALVLGIGVPSFQNFVRNSRITGVANEFLAAAYLARSEAIKRRATTVLCLSSNPTDETPDCAGDGTQGWIVFVDDADPDVIDAGADRNAEVDAGEEVLLRHGALHATVRVGSLPNANGGYVAFSPAGVARPLGGGAGAPLQSIVLCDDRGNVVVSGDDDSAARGVALSPIGRPRVTRSQSEIAGATFGGCP
jgi:type IV fimbrial biogenesis protein FimT